MRRQTKYLLSAAAVVVVLGGGVIGLGISSRQKEKDASNSTALVLMDRPVEDLSTVTVTNSTGSFSLRNQGEGQFADENLKDLPQDNDTVSKLITGVSHIEATELVNENASDPAIYGLAAPRADVSATFSDGETVALKVGDEAPGEKGIYFSTAEDGKVYLGSQEEFTPFLKGELEMVSHQLGEKASSSEVTRLTLSGSNYPQSIVLEAIPQSGASGDSQQDDGNLHRMVEPKNRPADSHFVNDLIDQAMGLQAAQVVSIYPSPEQLAQAGLSKPGAILTMEYGDGKTMTLRMAKGKDGALNAMKDGLPVLYRVSEADCPWYDAGLGDFISMRLLTPDLESLSSLTITGQSKTYRFALSGDADKLTVTCNEQPVDSQQFQEFYSFLMGLSADREEDGDFPETQPVLTVEYTYRDTTKNSDELSFQPSDDPEMLRLYINAEGGLLISKDKMEQLLEHAQEAAVPIQAH